MIEVRIHRRGGQGNVVAAYLLASAAFEVGRYGQAFRAFGAPPVFDYGYCKGCGLCA
jgi:pyruvate ferredoxin oxidoreductase gamma subunit